MLLAWAQLSGAARNFSPRIGFQNLLSVQTLSVCAAPLFAVHTLTCVRTWKIPNFGSHAVVCTWSERCLPYHCLDTQKYITFKVLQRFKVKRVCLSDRGNENQKLNTNPQNSGASACNCVVFSLNKERERTEMNFSQKVFISNISLWYNSVDLASKIKEEVHCSTPFWKEHRTHCSSDAGCKLNELVDSLLKRGLLCQFVLVAHNLYK